jgi:hypothetical protein
VCCPTVEYIRPGAHPFRSIDPIYLATHVNSRYSQSRELSCNHVHQAYSPGRRVLRISKRPEPVNLVHCPSCERHEPFCYSRRHRPTPKNTLRGNPGCAVGPKTPTRPTTSSRECVSQVLAVMDSHLVTLVPPSIPSAHPLPPSVHWHKPA